MVPPSWSDLNPFNEVTKRSSSRVPFESNTDTVMHITCGVTEKMLSKCRVCCCPHGVVGRELSCVSKRNYSCVSFHVTKRTVFCLPHSKSNTVCRWSCLRALCSFHLATTEMLPCHLLHWKS